MDKKQQKRTSGDGARPGSKVDYCLDLRGTIIPLTFLKITQAFRKIKTGQTMEIIGTDPDTKRDFPKILGTSPFEVLCISDEKDRYLIRLKKGEGQGS
jgi:TusA-related sulfurtransferase